MIKVPHFEKEADEAEWWFQNQHLVAAEFERVKPKLGPSSHVIRIAARRGITAEEMMAELEKSMPEEKEAATVPH